MVNTWFTLTKEWLALTKEQFLDTRGSYNFLVNFLGFTWLNLTNLPINLLGLSWLNLSLFLPLLKIYKVLLTTTNLHVEFLMILKKHLIQLIITYYFKKNFMAPFYGWGSTVSRLEPLPGGSLLFTTKFPEIPGTHFIDLARMKG